MAIQQPGTPVAEALMKLGISSSEALSCSSYTQLNVVFKVQRRASAPNRNPLLVLLLLLYRASNESLYAFTAV
jgi:hypothetical protein